MAARRLFNVSANAGAAVAIVFGAFAILAEPTVIESGWLHVKLVLVLLLLGVHVRIYQRITRLQDEPLNATRGEFSMMHGLVSALLLGILLLVFLKPF